MIVFTDGVFERRGETVDTGMDRLRRAVPQPVGGLDDTLDGLLANQITDESHDDTAILAVRWTTNPTT